MKRMRRSAVLPLLVAVGCTGTDGGSGAGSARDSAGVSIVEHGAVDWAAGASWTIPDSPAVSIGGIADAEEPYQLFQVTAARRDRNGRIHVLNAASGDVRIFDAEGRFVGRLGGFGRGPGEFRYPVALWLLAGDSVMVYDSNFGPRVVFAPNGTVARSETVDRAAVMTLIGADRATEDIRPMRGGGLVVATWTRGSDTSTPEGEMFRPSFRLMLLPPDLSAAAPLAPGGGIEQMWVSVGGERDNITAMFSPHYQIAIGGSPERIAIGNGDVYEIRVFDTNGALAQIIRRTAPPVAVTAADREDRVAAYMAFAEQNGRAEQMRRMLDAMPEQAYLPAHGELFVDDGGNVWVSEFRAPSHGVSRWSIHGPDGLLAGTLETSRALRLMDVGEDYVLAVERDEYDVERVVLLPLTRSR